MLRCLLLPLFSRRSFCERSTATFNAFSSNLLTIDLAPATSTKQLWGCRCTRTGPKSGFLVSKKQLRHQKNSRIFLELYFFRHYWSKQSSDFFKVKGSPFKVCQTFVFVNASYQFICYRLVIIGINSFVLELEL